MRTSFILAMAALALAVSANPQQRYRIVGLGDLPGGATYSEGLALNDLGQVVGRSHNGANRGFLWDAQRGMRDLGELPGGSDLSVATGINNFGQITGYSWAATTRAFLWTEEGGLQNIGELPGGWDYSQGFAINNDGWITGVSYGPTAYQAFRYHNGAMSPIPGLVTATSTSYGYAINNLGQIAGYAQSNQGPVAFRWDPEQGTTNLGDLPGGAVNSHALGMNDFGQVVGWGSPSNGRRAFLWSEATGMIDLGDLPGGTVSSEAHDINNAGLVVGKSETANGSRGFLWTAEGGMIDLNSLLSPGQSYIITDAIAINEQGQITGIASRNGVYEAFLATPIREVTGEVILGDWNASREGLEIEYYIQTGDLVESGTATLDFEGRVVFPTTNLDDGEYVLTIKASHWLTTTVAIEIIEGSASFAVTLINGDSDGDNEVSVGDYAILSAAFAASEGDPGWDARADLSGDRSVDIGDFAILSSNFGLSGS